MSSDAASSSERKSEIRERHRETAAEVVPDEDELGCYIGGEFVDAESGETFATRDPTTGEVLAEVPAGGEPDVDRAVEVARKTFEETWSSYGPSRRQELLHEIADTVEEKKEAFAKLETLDNGKPLNEAKTDVDLVVDHFRYFAAATRINEGSTVPTDASQQVQTIREPYGVVGQIIPWNFPLLMVSWKLGPALAAGNTVVLKPAEETPLSALKLMGEVDGILPDGVVNVVTGFGEEAGEPLTRHPDVRKLAFTGSTEVGRHVMKNAAENITDITLELGGKSPFIIFPDADVQTAVFNAWVAIFYNTGECCTAGSRLFVHADVREEFLGQLRGMAENMAVGDPLAEDTRMGPKVSKEQVERTMGFVEKAREEGGEFLAGGEEFDDEALADGAFVQPTIIEGLDHDSEAVQNEIFGPVLEVFEWEDYEEMMELANDVDYGLAAGVMTEDLKKAYRAAEDLEAGNIWVNTYNDFPVGQPFGGYKQSGIGREQAMETVHHYTQTKTINISLR